MPYKRAAGSGAASETVSGGHFDNDEYIYKATVRRMINIHKQTDTIVVLLTTVGLAQVRLISLWQSLSAAAHLLESLLFTCTSKSSHRCSW